MFKKKFRNIIPNTEETNKNKGKFTHFEHYSLGGLDGGLDDKVQLTINSIHTEKANNEVHGTFLYKIKNSSHFEVDIELDFGGPSQSFHIRAQEHNNLEPNKMIFKKHIEPFEEITTKKNNSNEDDGICKVQYHKGYQIKAKLRCAFTFPSPEKQRSFVIQDHNEIKLALEKWKKFRPSQIEQIILFTKDNDLSSSFDFSDNESEQRTQYRIDNPRLRGLSVNIETNDKKIFFVDEKFPPCQIEEHTIDLSKEITTHSKFFNTEMGKEKIKTIIFHYRAIESILPDINKICTSEKEFIPQDIQFGIIKHQSIISVFAHLAEHPWYIKRLFTESQDNGIGIYKVKLFLMSGWTTIFLDKFIPCFPMYFPIYTYSPKSLWPCLLEKAIAKVYDGYHKIPQLSFPELYLMITGLPIINYHYINGTFYVNTKYSNITSMTIQKKQIIEKINSQNYLVVLYASDEFIETNYSNEKKKALAKKIFPVVKVNESGILIKSIFNLQLKKFANIERQNHNDTIELEWGIFETLFDNILMIKENVNQELHFRNGFIRCQDYESPDYDRILAHTYYHLIIKQNNSSKYYPVTIVLRVSSDHFFDSSFLSPEIDWKIGVLKLEDKQNQNEQKEREKTLDWEKDPFKGKNPIYLETPDFCIGYFLVWELELKEGEYIIVPMTTGYCMQKSNKIQYKDYSLRDENHNLLPIEETYIPKFLDDLFYLNDPFCKDYLSFKVLQQINTNIIDNKGKKLNPIDEETFMSFCPEIKMKKGNIKEQGMSRLLFKDFFYEQMNLLNEEHRKQSIQNLGYENNMYPYLARFCGISFYFNFKDIDSLDNVTIIPKNNLIDNNMDSIVNIRLLEKKLVDYKAEEPNHPIRITWEKRDGWYWLEGVYMKKSKESSKQSPKWKLYSFEPKAPQLISKPEEGFFYSTNKTSVKTVIYPGKLLFVMYGVVRILEKKKNNEEKRESLKDLDKSD